jgi:hypothetical protein
MNQWIRDFFTKQTYIEERKPNKGRPKDGIVCNTGSSSPWKRNRGDIITADIIWVYWSENQQQLYQFSLSLSLSFSLSLSCHVEKKEGKSLLCYVGVFFCFARGSPAQSVTNIHRQVSLLMDGGEMQYFIILYSIQIYSFLVSVNPCICHICYSLMCASIIQFDLSCKRTDLRSTL